MKRTKKGFTLVELLVVIAILAILATVSVVGYTTFIQKAHISNDTAIVRQMNVALQANEPLDGKNATAYDAVQDILAAGFDIEKLTPTAEGFNIVWDQESDRIALLRADGSIEYSDGAISQEKAHLWKFVDYTNIDNLNDGYSHYLKKASSPIPFLNGVTTGIDFGDNTDAAGCEYVGNGTAQTVIIRTNSRFGNLTINAPKDTVKHFGEVATVHVIAVDGENCYEESGKVVFTQIDSGKYKTTETADVEILYVSNSSAVSAEIIPGTVASKGEGLALTSNFNANVQLDAIQALINEPRVLYVDRVGGNPGFYATFAEAYEAASANDIIHFTTGTFNEALAVHGKPVTIEGEGADKTFISGPEAYVVDGKAVLPVLHWSGWDGGQDNNVYALISANANVTIKNLTVKGIPERVGGPKSNPLVDTSANAFAGIHVQDADATIENVNIEGMMPTSVDGNSHHGFGLYITSTKDENHKLSYTNGTVSKTTRGGLYCWTDKYTLKFDTVTVIGNGNIDNPNGNITPDEDSKNNKYIYAYCGFYNYNTSYNASSKATYTNVEFIDVCKVDWGGAIWDDGSNPTNGEVTFTNCH